MKDLSIVRHSMMKWNLFIAACIFVAGLLLKVGAPTAAVVVGIGLAAVANLTARRRHSEGLSSPNPPRQ